MWGFECDWEGTCVFWIGVLVNDGVGNFVLDTGKSVEVPFRSNALSLVDIDGDGDLDVWTSTNQEPRGSVVMENDGTGKLLPTPSRHLSATVAASAIAQDR